MSDFSNEIFDNEALKDGDMGPWTIFLGVLVTLMPKIIPRVLPSILDDEKMAQKFQDSSNLKEAELLFTKQFTDNLQILERLVRAWKDDTLEPEKYGLGDIASRKDLVAGEPEGFQIDLLHGISFLKNRLDKMENRENSDHITQIADVVWNVVTTIHSVLF